MADASRRQFLRYGIAAGAAFGIPATAGRAIRARRVAVSGSAGAAHKALKPFLEPLPVPGAGIVVASLAAPGRYAFTLRQISRRLHPHLPPTPFFAYDDGSGLSGQAGSFGMAIAAQTGTPVQVSYTHALPAVYPSWIPVDTRLTPLGNAVRFMTHMHGGFVAATSDGNPELLEEGFGPGQTQTVYYPNQGPQQSARLMWFHDHADGATRLNVFAGLAAAYIVRDEYDTGAEPNPIGIPGGAYEVPLVIQDRQFNPDGTFLYPVSDIPGVTWIGEYFGDTMLVNGKVWPHLDVEPRLYRFRILNGCNARIMSLDFGPAPVWQIAAEGQLWDRPVPMRQLVLGPAERADVIADFRSLAGKALTLVNNTPAAPVSTPAPPLATVMQFRVGTTVTQPGPGKIPARLPGRAARLPAPGLTRYITLNEINPETADWSLNLNAMAFGESFAEPRAGTVEDWDYVNPMQPPTAAERGYKDTVKANPGYYTTIRARFDLPRGVSAPQTYVHHCHIVEHEDNDMMQPFTVVP
jgi:spore coat protein A